jgi:hypothetical protein
MTSRMSHLSTVPSSYPYHPKYFHFEFCFAFVDLWFTQYTDIRNWIRNIEQHASDNVNKILIGNKADMDESKRVRLMNSCFPLDLVFCIIWLWFTLHYNIESISLMIYFSIVASGCTYSEGASFGWWIWHQVFRNCMFLVEFINCSSGEVVLILCILSFRVPRRTSTWSKFFSPLPATLRRGLLRPTPSLRYG